MPLKVNADEFVEKHARRLKGATEDIRRGIQRVSVAPGELAAKKQEKMKAKLIAKIDDGTWAERVAGVSLEDWKRKAETKGIARIATGIDEAAAKVRNFAEQLLPAVEAAKSKVDSMPDMTLEDSINRMATFTREMSKFKKR